MRCPSCDARNPETADWCTQCYTSLRPEPEPEPEPGPDPEPAAPAAATGARADAPTGSDGPTRVAADDAIAEYESGDGRFRRTDEGIDWACDICSGWNPIERTTCTTCGATFASTVAEPEEAPAELVSETAALLSTAALPGLGHHLMGQTGAGLARGLLYLTWLVGGVLLLRSALVAQQSIVPALPLLLGAFVLWAVTILDALTVHRGRGNEVLGSRGLLWLTVGVVGLTMLSFAAAALTVTGPA